MTEKPVQRFTDEEIAASPAAEYGRESFAAFRARMAGGSPAEPEAQPAPVEPSPVETVTVTMPGGGRMTMIKSYAIERG